MILAEKQIQIDFKDKKIEIAEEMYIVSHVRKFHPRMGIRDINFKMLPYCVGREKFEELCKLAGLIKYGNLISPKGRRSK